MGFKRIKSYLEHPFLKITRLHGYQHNVIWGTIPLLYSNIIFPITDFFYIYIMFLFNVAFGFMINDYYDLENDRLSGKKTSVDLGYISKNGLLFLSLISLFISLALSSLMGIKSLIFMLAVSSLSFIYSGKPFRLKENSFLEFPVVVLAFGPLFVLYTSLLFLTNLNMINLVLFSASFLNISESQLSNCIRDFKGDKKSENRNLTQVIGKNNAIRLNIITSFLFIITTTTIFIIYNLYLLILLSVLFYGYVFLRMKGGKNWKSFMDSRKVYFSFILLVLGGILI